MLFCSLCLFILCSPIIYASETISPEQIVNRPGDTILGEIKISVPEIPRHTHGCDVIFHGTSDMFKLQTGDVGFVFPVSQETPLSFCASGQLTITGEWQCPEGQEESPEDVIIMGSQNIPLKFNVTQGLENISAQFQETAKGAVTFMAKKSGPLKCIKNLMFNFTEETPVSLCAHWVPNFRGVENMTIDANDTRCSWVTTADSNLLVDCVTMTIHQNISEKTLYGDSYVREMAQKESILQGISLRDTHFTVWIWTYDVYDPILEAIESGQSIPKLNQIQPHDIYSLTLRTIGLASKSPSLALVHQLADKQQCLTRCAWLLTGPEPVFQKRGSCENLSVHWSGHNSSVSIQQNPSTSNPRAKAILLQIFNHDGEDVVFLDI